MVLELPRMQSDIVDGLKDLSEQAQAQLDAARETEAYAAQNGTLLKQSPKDQRENDDATLDCSVQEASSTT